MAMALPVLPVMPAGYIAQQADLDNIGYGVIFMMTKPMTRIHDGAGGQSLVPAGTVVQFSVADYDTDGMWNSGSPTQLTVQTPGFYKLDYMCCQNNGISMNAAAQVVTGANNPAGSGLSTQCWPGYGYGVSRVCARGSGIIPWYMYALDWVTVTCYPNSTGGTLVSASTFTPTFLSLELVSI